MNINPSKLILGTANLHAKYGIKSFYINGDTSKKLLNYAYNNNVRTLDISSDYKFFTHFKNKKYKKDWKISFKITKKDLENLNTENNIHNFIIRLLKLFKKKKIEYFLFHHYKDLVSIKGQKIFKCLLNLKKKNKIGKIGVSVYSIDEIKKIIKKNKIDVIQAPFNVFDQRLRDIKILNLIKKNNIEIHARSVFLQGIILNKKFLRKDLEKIKEVKKWYEYIKKNNNSALFEVLNFINQNKFIKRIILGSRSIDQLKKILNTKITHEKRSLEQFKSKHLKLIDPRKW